VAKAFDAIGPEGTRKEFDSVLGLSTIRRRTVDHRISSPDVLTMPNTYPISQPHREPITDVDSVGAVEEAIRTGGPGRAASMTSSGT
jgi:hypothetical protein